MKRQDNNPTANLLLALARGQIRELMQWLDKHREPCERLVVEHWYGSRWYVTVLATPNIMPPQVVANFCVDVAKGCIVWNRQRNGQKSGLCLIRSIRWQELAAVRYPRRKPGRDYFATVDLVWSEKTCQTS